MTVLGIVVLGQLIYVIVIQYEDWPDNGVSLEVALVSLEVAVTC